ncbi:MAG TPA: UDP-N-acetylmuramoyl-L-alanine--D-glutamate ligase [Xanthomonadaceae bacterium]|nr:UDP-N-acetylmuramoyl-L-alanine--D-glutamate ligase [Xanthomonadaceae bacterium]
MRISSLESIVGGGGRVALWGWGREGRATYRAVRSRLPGLPLTLFCLAAEAGDARALQDPVLRVVDEPPGPSLADFAVVLKSPGISPYGDDAVAAAATGTRFLGGTALWFGERAGLDGRVPGTACITGTKGKSTSTALLAHLLRAGGIRTALAGNIGLPLLELLDAQADAWAIELSSYQTGDVAAAGGHPDVAVVLNLFPEHLDWHGGEARYMADKLRLVTDTRPRVVVLNAADPRLAALDLPHEVRWFGHADGWHLRGDVLHRGADAVMDTADLPLPGRHNRQNLCAVLTAIDALGHDAASLAPYAAGFAPLPHRLQPLGRRNGLDWVDDSISTTPHATLAALDMHVGQRVALIVGGHDRGLDWQGFAGEMATRAPHAIVTTGANGPRIHALLAPLAARGGLRLAAANDLDGAVAEARRLLAGRGVVLLSPGAPSFGAYRDYAERGAHFASLAGFDPEAAGTIPGLGVA